MKKYLVPVLAMLVSCGNDPGTKKEQTKNILEAATEVSTNAPDTLCFLRTDGLHNEDTAAVRLIVNNGFVEGKMMNLPAEKDWRLGNIRGEKRENTITASWKYMQEGMLDSIPVSFKLDGDRLLQQAPSFDPATGKEYLPGTASFSIEFHKIDCMQFPQYDFDLGIQ